MPDPAAALANRLLEREAWARERLAGHAGRTFVVRIGPLATGLRIEASGRLAPMPLADGAPDLTLTLSPLAVPSLLANPARWSELLVEAGDPALAATLRDLAQTLPWFVERTFAAAFGPIVGLRAANAGRTLLAFPEQAAARVAESLASYARDEAALLAGAAELDDLAVQSAALAERVDRLAERLDALAARIGATAPGRSPPHAGPAPLPRR
jgi:ubiquinone biosynthesis protein UbiJ